jgi:NhaP-type Na+/H+ or K+/H+ antiporter
MLLAPKPMGILGPLTQIAVVLLLGIVLKALSKRTGFPFIVALILAGTAAVSIGLLDINTWGGLSELIRTLALIIIVFSAGFHLQLREMQRDSKIIMLLATLGVMMTFAIITGITYSLLNISLLTAAFLGALLSGSDSAAITESTGEKSRLTTILLSESVFNQPLTLILPLLLLDYLVKPELAILNIPKLLLLVIVGGAVGLAGAVLGQKILLNLRTEHEEIAGLMIAISVFVIAENMLGSGILAVAITALLLSSRQIPRKEVLGTFSRQLAFLFTVFVFVLLGMQFSFQQLAQLSITREEIIAVIVALVIARVCSTLLVLFRTSLSLKERIKIGLIAPKGIAPAALAPLLFAHGFSDALTVVKIVYIAIITSVFISIAAMHFGGEKQSIREQAREKTMERALEKMRRTKTMGPAKQSRAQMPLELKPFLQRA